MAPARAPATDAPEPSTPDRSTTRTPAASPGHRLSAELPLRRYPDDSTAQKARNRRTLRPQAAHQPAARSHPALNAPPSSAPPARTPPTTPECDPQPPDAPPTPGACFSRLFTPQPVNPIRCVVGTLSQRADHNTALDTKMTSRCVGSTVSLSDQRLGTFRTARCGGVASPSRSGALREDNGRSRNSERPGNPPGEVRISMISQANSHSGSCLQHRSQIGHYQHRGDRQGLPRSVLRPLPVAVWPARIYQWKLREIQAQVVSQER